VCLQRPLAVIPVGTKARLDELSGKLDDGVKKAA